MVVTSFKFLTYLGEFGYIHDASREAGPAGLTSKEAYTAAIKRLQRFAHLPETGVVDRRTLELMERPRCGNKDELDETQDSSRRRHKRYVTANSKWEKNDLTYRIENTTPDLSPGRVRRILSDAFKVWSVVTPLTFTEVMHSDADILIQFSEGYHDDGYPFDGKGSVLAHAFFPGNSKGGDTHFDDAETWTFNSTDGVDLFMVAAHEFGHALGLAHSSNTEALMYPWYQGYTDNFRLPYDDVQGIQTLYGSPSNRLPNTPRPPIVVPDNRDRDRGGEAPITPRPTHPPTKDDTPCTGNIDAITVIRKEIFFFKGSKFWRRGPNGLAAKPTEISKFWYNLPSDGIDALYERSDGKITFFKGDRFWVFSSNHMVTNFPVEGRRITELGVGKNVKKIDAVFTWPYNKRTYLVTGDMYWKLNAKEDFIEYDYPRDMSIWKNVPVPLDSAFKYWDGKTYFLKGDQYWEFYDNKMRTRKKDGRPIGRLLGCHNGELKSDMTLRLSDDPDDNEDDDKESGYKHT
ncbi:MMP16-like protein [Mya arenaria]|uniref:MMP16-like protein n=1 Tax=Mya arenaria TaxID=6604 RepID=A0ABY7E3R0_MYAAR|nr:MMP16-like protein [Mya arenaria]